MIKIMIHGRKRTGKDTLADGLEAAVHPNKLNRWALADPLKDLLECMFHGINVRSGDRDLFNLYQLNTNIDYNYYFYTRYKINNVNHDIVKRKVREILSPYLKSDNIYYISPRKLLEKIGTDVFKELDNKFWLNLVPDNINIVTDIRFLDEFSFFLDKGFFSVKIDKPLDYEIAHKSDLGLDSEFFDIVIPYIYYKNKEELVEYTKRNCALIIKEYFEPWSDTCSNK